MNITEWLNQLYEQIDELICSEIDDVKGTISNECLWANGSNSSSETEMHLQNADELFEYVEKLKKMQKIISDTKNQIYNND